MIASGIRAPFRRLRLHQLLIALVLSLPLVSAADAITEGFSSTYTLAYNGFEIGVAERTLVPLGDGTAVFKSKAYPTGLARMLVSDHIIERSVLHTKTGLKPMEYSYTQTGHEKRNADVFFSWPKGEVVIQPAEERYPLHPGTLDALSFQLALMRDVAAGKTQFTYYIVDRSKQREYRFQTAGHERIRTPMGHFDAVKVTATAAEGGRSFDFWLAPQLDYLPVRIVSEEDDGDRTVMQLASYKGPPTDTHTASES